MNYCVRLNLELKGFMNPEAAGFFDTHCTEMDVDGINDLSKSGWNNLIGEVRKSEGKNVQDKNGQNMFL